MASVNSDKTEFHITYFSTNQFIANSSRKPPTVGSTEDDNRGQSSKRKNFHSMRMKFLSACIIDSFMTSAFEHNSGHYMILYRKHQAYNYNLLTCDIL